jgi:Fe-Mn family superoxide dismutase
MPANATAQPSLGLPPLPYAENALEPIVSAKTVSFHYGKHHRGYVDTVNRLIAGTALASLSLEALIHASFGNADRVALFQSAAQAWNHDFYWRSLKPRGGGTAPLALRLKMEISFGSVEACKKELLQCALSQFGSGWAWLVISGTALKVVKTANAETPITQGMQPLLTIDVWEHAYYLDYQNRRLDYVSGVIEQLLNWDFANANFEKSAAYAS